MLIRFIAALGAANFALILPLAASAQDVPSYAQGDAPQYAQNGPPPSYATQDQQVHGRVISFDGGYALAVRDDKGYVDNIQLHQGTVINPTGLTLASGMVVSVNGYAQGNVFAANEIDTPYTFYNAVPYYGGYPWYHYDSGISLGFFFGNNGWWHGDYYGRPAYFNGGYRTYNVGVYFGGGYGGGNWYGRNYVAPYNHGGYRGPVNGPVGPVGGPGYYHGTQPYNHGTPYHGAQPNGYRGAPQGYNNPGARSTTGGNRGGAPQGQGRAPSANHGGGGEGHHGR